MECSLYQNSIKYPVQIPLPTITFIALWKTLHEILKAIYMYWGENGCCMFNVLGLVISTRNLWNLWSYRCVFIASYWISIRLSIAHSLEQLQPGLSTHHPVFLLFVHVCSSSALSSPACLFKVFKKVPYSLHLLIFHSSVPAVSLYWLVVLDPLHSALPGSSFLMPVSPSLGRSPYDMEPC